MIKFSRKIYPFYIFVDLITLGVSFYVPYILKYNSIKEIFVKLNLPNTKEYSFIFVIWALFIIISFKMNNLHGTDRSLNIPQEILKVLISIFYTSIIVGSIVFFAQYKFFSRAVFLENVFLLCILLSSWRVVKRLILRSLIIRGFRNINVLIAGVDEQGINVLDEIRKNPYYGLNIVGFLDDNAEGFIKGVPVLGKLKDFSVISRKYFVDEVVVSVYTMGKDTTELMKSAKKMRLGFSLIPENFEESPLILKISYLGMVPLITYKERRHHAAEFALKKVFDFMASLVSSILFFPAFVIIAILIKFDSEGPIFYIQKRVGYKGKIFSLYKFRSMIKNAEELKKGLLEKNEIKDGIIFKIKKDPRVTKVGAFLRKYSLDELPQIFNVLKGDMSLVGPRPPTPDEVEKYNYMHMQRLSIRPGITCLSQIRGRNELTFRKWVKLDLWYINNWSFGLDLKVILWTIPTVLNGKGAY